MHLKLWISFVQTPRDVNAVTSVVTLWIDVWVVVWGKVLSFVDAPVVVVVAVVVAAVVMVAFDDVVAGMAEQQPHTQVFLQFLISLGAYDWTQQFRIWRRQ